VARLEDIAVGASVSGLAGNATASVVAVKWHGTNAITVTYKNNAGNVAEQILFREDEERLSIEDGSLPWSFDADANLLRLASEAYAYNSLVIAWPDVQAKASEIQSQRSTTEQMSFFDYKEDK